MSDQERPQRNLTAPEAAAYLRISRRTLWSMTNAGEVPHLRLGRRVLYPESELQAWIASRVQGGGQPMSRAG